MDSNTVFYDETTEKDALLKEEEERIWHEQYDNERIDYIRYIDENLALGTDKAYNNIENLFNDKLFCSTYLGKDSEIAYLFIILTIYKEEINSGEQHTILRLGKDCETLISCMQQLKFILWRIEFTHEEEADKLLTDYIKSYNVSACAIKNAILRFSVDKTNILLHMVSLFLNNNMLSYAFYILIYLSSALPGNEDVLTLLAELYAIFGNMAKAKECLDAVDNPGSNTERIRTKYGL